MPHTARTMERLPEEAAALRQALLDWYRVHQRDLPWRRSRDPYAIWVAEVMLQQTTVAAVIPFWHRFLEAFPTLSRLAEANETEVLKLWAGLGYYRRAKNLQLAARDLAARGESTVPSDPVVLRSLPGVGEYTAAAVASIAFGIPDAVVDGNVVRVLTRLTGATADPSRQPLRSRLREWAGELLDPAAPGEFNQALMELGATVCSPRAPRCGDCPWKDACIAHRTGTQESIPNLPARRESVTVVRGAVLVRKGDGVLLARIDEGEPNAGLWEFPSTIVHHGARDMGPAPKSWSPACEHVLHDGMAKRGFALERAGEVLARCRHAITHHRIEVYLLDASLAAQQRFDRTKRVWSPLDREPEVPLSAIGRKLWRLVTGPAETASGKLREKPRPSMRVDSPEGTR